MLKLLVIICNCSNLVNPNIVKCNAPFCICYMVYNTTICRRFIHPGISPSQLINIYSISVVKPVCHFLSVDGALRTETSAGPVFFCLSRLLGIFSRHRAKDMCTLGKACWVRDPLVPARMCPPSVVRELLDVM